MFLELVSSLSTKAESISVIQFDKNRQHEHYIVSGQNFL